MPPYVPAAAHHAVQPHQPQTTTVQSSTNKQWCPAINIFNIGIIVGSNQNANNHIAAIANPASSCSVAAIASLAAAGGVNDEWKKQRKISDDKTMVYHGQLGVDAILNNSDIDGIYVTGNLVNKSEVIERALRAGKHVLTDDPVTTSVADYTRLLNIAHACQRHLQDTTMFDYHNAVRKFLDSVLDEKEFGKVKTIAAKFDINPQDANNHGIMGCSHRDVVGDLVRYCAVLGVLVFQRSGRAPVSAQVLSVDRDNHGVPVSCQCTIMFEGGAAMSVTCSYLHAGTRQSVAVDSDTHSASMEDFFFCSHSLANYRVYEKTLVEHESHTIAHGTSVDVEGGPLQEVCAWRRFAELSANAYNSTNQDDGTNCGYLFGRHNITYAAVQSQNIVSAIMDSIDNDCTEVEIREVTVDFEGAKK